MKNTFNLNNRFDDLKPGDEIEWELDDSNVNIYKIGDDDDEFIKYLPQHDPDALRVISGIKPRHGIVVCKFQKNRVSKYVIIELPPYLNSLRLGAVSAEIMSYATLDLDLSYSEIINEYEYVIDNPKYYFLCIGDGDNITKIVEKE